MTIARRKGDHCQKLGHTWDKYWKIYGKPIDWKPSKSTHDKERCENHTSTNEVLPIDDSNPFSKRASRSLSKTGFQQSQASTIGTRMLAQKGNYLSALTIKIGRTNCGL